MSFIVAIDGPAGSGKGTITKLVAKKLNLINIDTGAMYRCVALEALKNGIDSTEVGKIEKMMKDISIQLKRQEDKQVVLLNNQDVSEEIRSVEVDNCVAKFAAIKCVRDKMTPLQRKMRELGNIIMEGRDIATAVFPDADVKIYLNASIEERAKRRYKQDLEKGMQVTYEEVLEGMIQRHKLETEREIAPLRKTADAIEVDTSNMTIEEVTEEIIKIIENKMQKERKDETVF